jgi:hypothetical protein
LRISFQVGELYQKAKRELHLMSDEEAFVKVIQANPNDELSRLVYAD